ncbi:MAG: sigma 54-interacting transcriptional regulator [Polyangiaceae bacterium]
MVVSGREEGREAPFDGEAIVGSESGSDLYVSDGAVSRRHVAFTFVNGRVVVRDAGSRNGTFLGDERIDEREIPVGAVIRIGNSSIALQVRTNLNVVPPHPSRTFGSLVGDSVAMRKVFAVLDLVADSTLPVLVEGEAGTETLEVAESLHAASGRDPLVVIRAATLSRDSAESEMFGAAAGVGVARFGAFQRAEGGTLVIEDLADLPEPIQAKLARTLATGTVKPVGDTTVRKVDVRVVAVTNRDLHAEAQRNRFRADLFHGFSAARLRLPPLRERPEDVPALVARAMEGKVPQPPTVQGENLRKLMSHGWPGNVAELRRVVRSALSRAPRRPDGSVAFDDLTFALGPSAETSSTVGYAFPGVARPAPFREARAQALFAFESAYVTALLERSGGDLRRAAQAAGMDEAELRALLARVDGI